MHSPQPDRAIEIARQVAARSKSPLDYVWLGRFLALRDGWPKARTTRRSRDRKLEEAEHALRQAVQLGESSPVAWVALVEFLARTGKTAEAAKVTTTAKQKIPSQQAALALAECYDALGDTVEAGRYYAEALARSAEDATVLGLVADFDIRCGKQAEAESLLERIVAGQVRGSRERVFWARRTLAAILAAQGGTRISGVPWILSSGISTIRPPRWSISAPKRHSTQRIRRGCGVKRRFLCWKN